MLLHLMNMQKIVTQLVAAISNLVHNFLGVLDNLTFDKKSVVLHNLMNPSRAPGKTSSSRDDMEPKL